MCGDDGVVSVVYTLSFLCYLLLSASSFIVQQSTQIFAKTISLLLAHSSNELFAHDYALRQFGQISPS